MSAMINALSSKPAQGGAWQFSRNEASRLAEEPVHDQAANWLMYCAGGASSTSSTSGPCGRVASVPAPCSAAGGMAV